MKSQLKLSIENETKTYTSGDTINGVVRLDVQESLEVKEIVVTFYGIAKAKNAKQVAAASPNGQTRRKHYETRETSLLKIPIQVFPPRGVQQLQHSSYTLIHGVYKYPFSVVIPYPNSTGALPPSFLYEHGRDFAQVIYEVSAIVKTPHFYRSNLSRYQHIKFTPPNATLQTNLGHVSDRSGALLPRRCGKVTSVKYESTQMATRSPLKRLFSSNSVKIPFELLMEFSQNNSVPELSKTRVVEMNKRISSSFNLSLLCPFNETTIQKLLFTDNEHSRQVLPGSWPDRATLRLAHISVTLRGTVTYKGAKLRSKNYISRVLVDKHLNQKLELAKFEPTRYYQTNPRSSLVYGAEPNTMHLVRSSTVYKLALKPSWFDTMMTDDLTSSFMCPNIENDYELTIKLMVVSMPGERCETLKYSTNVVLIQNDRQSHFQPPSSPQAFQQISQQSPILTSDPEEPPPPYRA